MAGPLVYVVIGSRGEYSERYEWVAGVFADKATAINMAQTKLQASKAADVLWNQSLCRYGPPPAPGDADDYTVVEVPMNTWGTWDSIDLA